jgi:hypothetical protein
LEVLLKNFQKKWGFLSSCRKTSCTIDAAETTTIEPYIHTVIKGPIHPEKVAQELSTELGYPIAIMDINDIGGCWVIGASKGFPNNFWSR